MATLYIREYRNLGRDADGRPVNSGNEPAITDQIVAIGVAAQSNAFNAQTCFVRLHADAICSVLFGANPTAAATNARLAANQTEYFTVVPGAATKVSVITNS